MAFRFGNERGQALPLLLVAMAITMVALLVVVHWAGAVDDAARARTAADAAALAGVAEGRAEAVAVASANGGVILHYSRGGGTVEVVVEVGRARARAAAEIVVEWVASGGIDRGDE